MTECSPIMQAAPQEPDGLKLAYVESPIGLVEVAGNGAAIVAVNFVDERRDVGRDEVTDGLVEQLAVEQLAAYFAGERTEFDLPLELHGTDFQCAVWRELLRVPLGKTVAYREIANALGKPNAVRAVGAANGQNPISIIVPCHRIIGSDGTLTGYGGGLWRKEWLLRHEGALLL